MRYLLSLILLLFVLPVFSQEIVNPVNPLEASPAIDTIPVRTSDLDIQEPVSKEEPIELESPNKEQGFLSHLNIALRVSTMGLGLELATPLNGYFNLRAGINHMGYKRESLFNIDLEDPNGDLEEAIGYIPAFRTKADVNFTNGHLLLDFHPVKKGIFHITAGVFVGTNKFNANGFLADEEGNPSELINPGGDWPSIEFDGHVLTPDDGNLNVSLQLGQVIKPYAGFGLGRAISKSRVSFMFEVGVIYQGDYSLKENGRKIDVSDTDNENFKDVKTYTQLLKWWPMMNFQLTYRIF